MTKKNMFALLLILVLLLGCSCGGGSGDGDSDASDDDTNLADDDDSTPDDDVDDDAAPDDDTTPNDDDTAADDDTGEVWTDSISGLVWQNDDAGKLNWEDAKSYCANLNWGGFGDWRLPTISELRSLIRGCDDTATGGACNVTDDCLAYFGCWNPPCQGCGFLGGPGPGGRYWPAELSGDGWIYWSSLQVEENPYTAWRVHFYNGLVSYNDKEYLYSARCVR